MNQLAENVAAWTEQRLIIDYLFSFEVLLIALFIAPMVYRLYRRIKKEKQS